MVLRLSSAAARLTLVFVALILVTMLSYLSIRNALATYYSGLETQAGYERAAQLEPRNAEHWFLLGRYWQYNLEEPDAQRAISAYRTSLTLDPRAASTWLDLATAYESQGDLPAAREAFLHAKRVYPVSAEVSWRYGNFLLRQNELPAAFAEICQAVSVDPKRAPEAFSRCWRVDPDIQAILDHALPPTVPVYLDAIRELAADAAIDPALAVWIRLTALHPQLPLARVIPFIDSLTQAHRIDDAGRVWNQAVALADSPPPADPQPCRCRRRKTLSDPDPHRRQGQARRASRTGSDATDDCSSNSMTRRSVVVYRSQPGSPSVTNRTHAPWMASARP